MDSSADDLNIVELVAHKLMVNVSLDLTLFKITSSTLESTDVTDLFKGVIMKMSLKRKVMNELLTTFLPSILLMIITFATTSFKPFFFEAALSVNLTTMLMMTTISIGKMQTLPTTAYIRMIDVWLVFCQLSLLYIACLQRTGRERRQSCNSWRAWGVAPRNPLIWQAL